MNSPKNNLSALRILWVGPAIDEAHFSNPAVSAAASMWQQSLISSLLDQNTRVLPEVQIEVVSHLPHRCFPRGALRPEGGPSIFPASMRGFAVKYINIPILRNWMLGLGYMKAIKELIASAGTHPYDLIVSYNVEAYLSRSVAKLARKNQITWVSIIADLPKVRPRSFLECGKAHLADGRIFLSWKNFKSYAQGNEDLFLEGGVAFYESNTPDDNAGESLLRNEEKIKRIAYFGGITTLGGIDLFLEATRYLPGPQYQFHIAGAGEISRLQPFLKDDSRINYHGAITQKELINLGRSIDVFVDPRPSSHSENNFPSKILTYLGFSKPIISTMGLGIPPEYSKVLIKLQSEEAKTLAQNIGEICSWDQARVHQHQVEIQEFVASHKSWGIQGKRALDWMRLKINQRRGDNEYSA